MLTFLKRKRLPIRKKYQLVAAPILLMSRCGVTTIITDMDLIEMATDTEGTTTTITTVAGDGMTLMTIMATLTMIGMEGTITTLATGMIGT